MTWPGQAGIVRCVRVRYIQNTHAIYVVTYVPVSKIKHVTCPRTMPTGSGENTLVLARGGKPQQTGTKQASRSKPTNPMPARPMCPWPSRVDTCRHALRATCNPPRPTSGPVNFIAFARFTFTRNCRFKYARASLKNVIIWDNSMAEPDFTLSLYYNHSVSYYSVHVTQCIGNNAKRAWQIRSSTPWLSSSMLRPFFPRLHR